MPTSKASGTTKLEGVVHKRRVITLTIVPTFFLHVREPAPASTVLKRFLQSRLSCRRVSAGILRLGLRSDHVSAPAGRKIRPKEQAAALAKKAKKAARSGQPADAYLLYSEAAALQPKNKKLKAQMEALQARAAAQSPPVVPGAVAGMTEPKRTPRFTGRFRPRRRLRQPHRARIRPRP